MRKLSVNELNRDSLEYYKNKEKTEIVIILDHIRSGLNVGSIFRTCDAFPVKKIYLLGYTPDPTNKEVQKSALGSQESVSWEKRNDSEQLIQELKLEGYEIAAVEQAEPKILINEFVSTTNKIALVLGNEVYGVSETVMKHCNYAIEIPQMGTKHSLNVAVCAGIAIWQIFNDFGYLKK
jgi:tRNA G18 (ribose-2'-O)-methylase SpoU